jgi:hypothetical protein
MALRRRFKIFIALALMPPLGFVVLIACRINKSVLLQWDAGDCIRPPQRCLLNPFRDRAPEALSEKVLYELRAGNVESIRNLLPKESSEHFVSMETKFPIESWKVGDRVDRPSDCEITYWVHRGGGYGSEEEEVVFHLRQRGNWFIDWYNAIY